MRVLIYRLLALVSFLVFAIAIAGAVLGTINGTSKNFVTLFQMLANPALALKYPELILRTVIMAAGQLLLISMFYFLGRWFWRRSIPQPIAVSDISDANGLAPSSDFVKQENSKL
jgi:uncharacterized membrane protein